MSYNFKILLSLSYLLPCLFYSNNFTSIPRISMSILIAGIIFLYHYVLKKIINQSEKKIGENIIFFSNIIFGCFVLNFWNNPFLNNHLQIMISSIWVSLNSGVLIWKYFPIQKIGRPIGLNLILMAVTGLLILPKFPWQYQNDITSYYLNFLLFSFFLTGLIYFSSQIISRKIWIPIIISVCFLYYLPIRGLYKIFLGHLPPDGINSGILMIIIVLFGIVAGNKLNKILIDRKVDLHKWL